MIKYRVPGNAIKCMSFDDLIDDTDKHKKRQKFTKKFPNKHFLIIIKRDLRLYRIKLDEIFDDGTTCPAGKLLFRANTINDHVDRTQGTLTVFIVLRTSHTQFDVDWILFIETDAITLTVVDFDVCKSEISS